jgi:hypothetical protein
VKWKEENEKKVKVVEKMEREGEKDGRGRDCEEKVQENGCAYTEVERGLKSK